MTFAENLIQLRKQRGMSQEQLAEKLAVSRQAVSKWEAGINMPDIPKLIAIADQFDITLDSLLRVSIANKKRKVDIQQQENDFENRENKTINIISEGNTYTISSGSTLYIKNGYNYKSKIRIGRFPLLHIHTGHDLQCACGIIAIGNIAVGLIAVGGLSFGLFTVGGISVGLLLALGGCAIGGITLGGFSLGLIAFGGCAIGMGAIRGLAVGKTFAVGAAAYGPVSIGTNSEAVFRITEHTAKEDIIRYIEANASYIPVFLRKLFL